MEIPHFYTGVNYDTGFNTVCHAVSDLITGKERKKIRETHEPAAILIKKEIMLSEIHVYGK